jgi:hypothetical protein
MQESVQNPDPKFHVSRIEKSLEELIRHLRDDAAQVNEPKAQALFETSAEVVAGLRAAFEHYRQGSEAAMRP